MAKSPSSELTPVDLMYRQMALAAEVQVLDPRDFVNRIVTSILEAETDEDIFAAAEASGTKSEAYVGIPIMIESVAYAKSGFAGGPPVFSIVTGHDAMGEIVTYQIGAESAQTQLWAFDRKGSFPLIAVLTSKASKSNEGNTALFYKAPTPAEIKSFG